MESKEPRGAFEVFINEDSGLRELIEGIELYPRQRETQPSGYRYNAFMDQYEDPKSGKVISLFYETRYSDKIDKLIPEVDFRLRMNVEITNLANFIDYLIADLKRQGVNLDKEEIMLGEKPEDGILYELSCHDYSIGDYLLQILS